MHFRYITGIIVAVQEEVPWVVILSTQIMNGSLSFVDKDQWNLVQHWLSPTMRDNVLSLYRFTLVAGIIEGYDIDVAKILAREI